MPIDVSIALYYEKLENNKYLNRVSDFLLVLSRYSNLMLNKPELLWNPNFEDIE